MPNPPDPIVACPTGQSRLARLPGGADALVIAVMGLFGGALSAGVFIRGLYVNSASYNVALPLAVLKLPVGATVAVAGMILMAGDFVPGFSAIDKQNQILAYALVFGFAQQVFTQMLDQRAEKLISSIPSKARDEGGPPAQNRSTA